MVKLGPQRIANVEGQNTGRVVSSMRCGYRKAVGHSIANCPQVKPCAICGRRGQKTAQCKEKARGFEQIYGIEFDHYVPAENLVPVTHPFQVVSEDEEKATGSAIVNVVGNLGKKKRKLLYIQAQLAQDKRGTQMLINTGSSCNILGRALCKNLHLPIKVSHEWLMGLNGSRSAVEGKMKCMLE